MRKAQESTPSPGGRKDYPIHCVECGKKEVRPAVVKEEIKKSYDGRIYDLVIDDLPVRRCSACGEVYYSVDSDERILAALRRQLRLLTPEHIRANLRSLSLQQNEAAARLGIAPETLSRWLSGGMVQSRAMDNLLRAFFACPDLRHNLSARGPRRRFGETVTSA